MAKTALAAGDALVQSFVEEDLRRESIKNTFTAKFRGPSKSNIIYENTTIEGVRGDTITEGLSRKGRSAGVTGKETLEGKEEALGTSTFTSTLELYRNAFRDDGSLSRKFAKYDVSAVTLDTIQEWMTEKQDLLSFAALQTSLTRVFYQSTSTATPATAKSALTATDLLTPSLITRAKTWAMTGGNRSTEPLKPVLIGGKKYLVLVAHPDQTADLFEDPQMQQARREAEVRGKENPIFSGSAFIYNGVIVHESEYIDIATDAGTGADVPWANSLLLGASALMWQWGRRPYIVKEDFDYKNERGVAINMIAKATKPTFDVNGDGTSTDYGVVGVHTARTRISDPA